MTQTRALTGRRVLVVEDEYFLAANVAGGLREAGAEVIEPAGRIDDALHLIDEMDPADAAVLDLNLHGEMAFPVADALLTRGVPFVFATGYDQAVIPERFAHIPRCEKPISVRSLVGALLA